MQFSASLMIAIAALVAGTSAQPAPNAQTSDPCPSISFLKSMSECRSNIKFESVPACASGYNAVCRKLTPPPHPNVSPRCKKLMEARPSPYYYLCLKPRIKPS